MLKIAHRGASGHCLENSLSSLLKAIELNADVVEADIQLTSDNVPIVFHDRLLDRTTRSSGFVNKLSWSEIQENVRLTNDEAIPSLDSFAAVLSQHDIKLYLDLKVTNNLDQIVSIALKHLPEEKLFVGSFHFQAIKEIKEKYPAISTIMIIEGNPIEIERVVENSSCDIVAFGFDSIEKDEIERVKAMGKKVFVWTVNHPLEIQMAKDLGVDGITSNFPDLL